MPLTVLQSTEPLRTASSGDAVDERRLQRNCSRVITPLSPAPFGGAPTHHRSAYGSKGQRSWSLVGLTLRTEPRGGSVTRSRRGTPLAAIALDACASGVTP